MGKKRKTKFIKSEVTTNEDPSRYTHDTLDHSIQYTEYSDEHVLGRSLNSGSSQDSTATVYGLPLHRAVLVVANAALGAGMLNFPQAYDKSGGLLNALTVQTVSWVYHHFLVGKGWSINLNCWWGKGGVLTSTVCGVLQHDGINSNIFSSALFF